MSLGDLTMRLEASSPAVGDWSPFSHYLQMKGSSLCLTHVCYVIKMDYVQATENTLSRGKVSCTNNLLFLYTSLPFCANQYREIFY